MKFIYSVVGVTKCVIDDTLKIRISNNEFKITDFK